MEKDSRLFIRVSEREKNLINQKMKQIGIKNFSAYARKILIDGYIIKEETRTDENVVIELKRIGNNINQIAKKLNSNLMVEDNIVEELIMNQRRIWQLLK